MHINSIAKSNYNWVRWTWGKLILAGESHFKLRKPVPNPWIVDLSLQSVSQACRRVLYSASKWKAPLYFHPSMNDWKRAHPKVECVKLTIKNISEGIFCESLSHLRPFCSINSDSMPECKSHVLPKSQWLF